MIFSAERRWLYSHGCEISQQPQQMQFSYSRKMPQKSKCPGSQSAPPPKKIEDWTIINMIQLCTEEAKWGLQLKLRSIFVKYNFFFFLYFFISQFCKIQESKLPKITFSKGWAEENFQSFSDLLHLTYFLLLEDKHIETYLKINQDKSNKE